MYFPFFFVFQLGEDKYTINYVKISLQIFYLVTDSPQKVNKKQEEEIEVVPASYSQHSLVFLDKYTEYRIQVLAFNPAGDGPRSPPITVKTKQVRVQFINYIIIIQISFVL